MRRRFKMVTRSAKHECCMMAGFGENECRERRYSGAYMQHRRREAIPAHRKLECRLHSKLIQVPTSKDDLCPCSVRKAWSIEQDDTQRKWSGRGTMYWVIHEGRRRWLPFRAQWTASLVPTSSTCGYLIEPKWTACLDYSLWWRVGLGFRVG